MRAELTTALWHEIFLVSAVPVSASFEVGRGYKMTTSWLSGTELHELGLSKNLRPLLSNWSEPQLVQNQKLSVKS